MKYTIDDIAAAIGMSYDVVGEPRDKYFTGVKSIYDADRDSLVWLHPKKEIDLNRTKASIVICTADAIRSPARPADKCYVIVDNPRLAYIRVVEKYFVTKPEPGIHPTAFVHEKAIVSGSAYIGPFTYIGKSEVGDGTVIYGNCHIYDGIKIGRNVTIHAGTVIGADGFGYSRDEQGKFEKFPHIGGVVIEDEVEIGANTCIDRG
ncbi:MAG: UDP-3-O-(3-hydroxymyristoyl)glucosamine N-acyltransferase, partial [Bacteroidetes bacterium]|nr:UDP-3-O-(3-hydroxymyristoyl)glucosamine N-acyltransferase [Bacteroidota bacterium]